MSAVLAIDSVPRHASIMTWGALLGMARVITNEE